MGELIQLKKSDQRLAISDQQKSDRRSAISDRLLEDGDEQSSMLDPRSSILDPQFTIDGVDRRNFMKLIGASLALTGLTGCTRQTAEQIAPYVRQPEEIVPGRPQYYA